MADQFMRIGVRGEDGLAKPVSGNNSGNIVTSPPVKDLLDTQEVPAEGSIETEVYRFCSQVAMLTLYLPQESSSGTRIVDIKWMNDKGDVLKIEESALIYDDVFERQYIEAKAPKAKFVVRNTHTSARQVSLTAASISAFSDSHVLDRLSQIEGKIDKMRLEAVRPKQTIISSHQLAIPEDSFASPIDTDNKYVMGDATNPRIYVGEFAFVCFLVRVVGGTSEDYELYYQMAVDIGDDDGEGLFRRSDFDGKKDANSDARGEEGVTAIMTSNHVANSDWVEVKGNIIRTLRLKNNDSQERTFNVAIIGIR